MDLAADLLGPPLSYIALGSIAGFVLAGFRFAAGIGMWWAFVAGA